MNYQFVTLIALYILQILVIWNVLNKENKSQSVKKGRSDLFGVNLTRGMIALSPFIVLCYEVKLSNEILQYSLYFIGLICYLFGLSIYYKARKILNENFNASPVVMEKHQLITNGIYKSIRHPIYTSYLVKWIGLTLITVNWILSIIVGLFVLRMIIRIKEEEKVLVKEFGQAYLQYQESSGMLLPKLRSY